MAGPVAAQRGIKLERDRARGMLKAVSREVQKLYYDPTLRGLDWKGLTAEAARLIENAQSPSDMFTAIFLLVNNLGDSHTVFVPPLRSVRYLFGFDAQAFGNEVRVSRITEGGAAQLAGLEVGDRILQVNGFNAERASIDLMMLVFRALRPVTEMHLVISRRAGPAQQIRVRGVERREALVTDLTKIDNIYQLIRQAESEAVPFRYSTFDDGIGYLQLPEFHGDTDFLQYFAKRVRKAPATIVDLRGNPGGSVRALEVFSGFFEPDQVVIAEIVGRTKPKPIRAKPQKPQLTGPLHILVDSQTGSAAEVFARHFQRTRQGVVSGDRTAARVTASRVLSLRVGADVVVQYGLQVAIGRLVFPDGGELEGTGVTPDQLCVPSEEDLRQGKDVCLAKARAELLARLPSPDGR